MVKYDWTWFPTQYFKLHPWRPWINIGWIYVDQNEHRDSHYIENYNYLKKDFENRPEGAGVHGPNMGPFHYGSLYSNPGIVLHFLVRLPPFTKLLLDYQVTLSGSPV